MFMKTDGACWLFWLFASAFSIKLLNIWACDLHYCWQKGSEVSRGWWFISPCLLLIPGRSQRTSEAINWMQISTTQHQRVQTCQTTSHPNLQICRSCAAVLQSLSDDVSVCSETTARGFGKSNLNDTLCSKSKLLNVNASFNMFL